nr:putative ribonuclease H-like domain-containing protein [Tanacetum cinerariifolium]
YYNVWCPGSLPVGFSDYNGTASWLNALKDALKTLKGKALADDVVSSYSIAPEILNIDVAKLSTSASGSQPSGNTKKDKNQRPPCSIHKNKVEAHPRTVKSSLKRNECPLTRITTTTEVPSRKSISVDKDTLKHVVTLVYSRKPRISKSTNSVSKSKVGISHEKSVAHSLQQNGVVERRNRTLIEATRTMLIYAKAPLFLWAEAVATACYTQNRSIVRLRHVKTPYELLHDKLSDLSFFHEFGALCYLTIDSENLGKLQPKVDFGLVPNPPSSTPFVPPLRTDWDMLFQPLFDELLTPPPSVHHPAPKVITLIVKVVALEPVASTGSPSSTTVDQDAPLPSNSQTTPKTQYPIIPNDVEEDNHD